MKQAQYNIYIFFFGRYTKKTKKISPYRLSRINNYFEYTTCTV